MIVLARYAFSAAAAFAVAHEVGAVIIHLFAGIVSALP